MACKRFCGVKTFEIIARVTGDGYVVVVYQEFDVKPPGHRIAGSLSVVTLLLGTVAAEHHQRFIPVCFSHPVDVAPHISEPPRAEKDTGRFIPLRVAVKAMAEFTVVEQISKAFLAVQGGHHVLDGNPMPSLVEIDRVYL